MSPPLGSVALAIFILFGSAAALIGSEAAGQQMAWYCRRSFSRLPAYSSSQSSRGPGCSPPLPFVAIVAFASEAQVISLVQSTDDRSHDTGVQPDDGPRVGLGDIVAAAAGELEDRVGGPLALTIVLWRPPPPSTRRCAAINGRTLCSLLAFCDGPRERLRPSG